MSMGFESFLQKTRFPEWFPLSNLQISQQKFLDTLGLKKDQRGNVVWDQKKAFAEDSAGFDDKLIPMEPRSRYRVVCVGGGIAGLSCCLELFRLCDREGIDVEVVLVEGRSRFGGRLITDRKTFKDSDGTAEFPVGESGLAERQCQTIRVVPYADSSLSIYVHRFSQIWVPVGFMESIRILWLLSHERLVQSLFRARRR
jgi:NAD(P)-binding Rossmann-like domain